MQDYNSELINKLSNINLANKTDNGERINELSNISLANKTDNIDRTNKPNNNKNTEIQWTCPNCGRSNYININTCSGCGEPRNSKLSKSDNSEIKS